jgi:putative transcriptional regulator
MIILISTKFIDGEAEAFKVILRQLIITSMLVIAISKEKIEDEMIIKIERAILDITQDELATKVGISRQTINSIEKNRYVPSTVFALKLSEVFGKPVNDFFRLEDSD